MGVHTKTTNLAVYGDCGRYPLYIDQITQCVKYYHHLENTENELLKQFYSILKNHETSSRENELLGFLGSVQKLGKITIPANPNRKSSSYLDVLSRASSPTTGHCSLTMTFLGELDQVEIS